MVKAHINHSEAPLALFKHAWTWAAQDVIGWGSHFWVCTREMKRWCMWNVEQQRQQSRLGNKRTSCQRLRFIWWGWGLGEQRFGTCERKVHPQQPRNSVKQVRYVHFHFLDFSGYNRWRCKNWTELHSVHSAVQSNILPITNKNLKLEKIKSDFYKVSND